MYPLLLNKEKLADLDILIKYHDKLNENIVNCDTLLIDSKFFRNYWKDKRDYVISLLQGFREKCKQIIWLDTTDSTGATHFQVLPYVDKYWKKQLLKDVKLYERKYFGARIYTDYYKTHFKLNPKTSYSVDPIKKEHVDKLACSWNLGLGPIMVNTKITKIFRRIPWFIKEKLKYKYENKSHLPTTNRTNDICFRGSFQYNNDVLSLQRIKTIEKLIDRGVESKPIKYKNYIEEITKSKIAVSPFGAGEICFRDFEIFLAGAVLFKPSMSHVKTYPEVFVDNESYMSFNWDFSDFNEKLDYLLQNRETLETISQYAQDTYKNYLSKWGQEEFCQRLFVMLK